jgi:hypothetical protein
MRITWPSSTLALLLALGLAAGSRAAPCEGCFALVVLPDTQFYTQLSKQPRGAAHLDLVTRWICAQRSAWTEPSTGKEMPLVMVIQLGDLVQTGDRDEDQDGTLDEWERVDAAFDNLDACPGGGSVPYLVTLGNHDLAQSNQYQAPTAGYNQFFGTSRWAPYQCANPSDCDWAAGEWFIGGGDTILARSRNNADGTPGPPTDQPGRHRAAVIRTPGGQRLLFIGIEAGFDFPPPAHPDEGDDLAWLRDVLADYPGVPTILFHHALIGPLGGFPTSEDGASFGSDSIVSTQDIWDRIGAPDDQTLMTFNGHWTGYTDPDTGKVIQAREYDELLQTDGGFDVFAFFRNYQGMPNRDAAGNLCLPAYGGGWLVIAAFDPGAQEIRVRSYRIDDVDDDCTHDGTPADAADLETDWGLPETVLAYDFPDTRPPSLDNCPGVPNPDQSDGDGDGVGDACELACADGTDNDGDGSTDFPGDPGCESVADATETDDSGSLPCDDGIDNDGDGRSDFDPVTRADPGDETTLPAGQGDPGCASPAYFSESPACQDGLDNDGSPGVDYDGGLFLGLSNPPDPQCEGGPWRNREARGCGFGFELALLLGLLAWAPARRGIRALLPRTETAPPGLTAPGRRRAGPRGGR